ncbi:MalY/PatB family protein ['Paenibacillus yunnanensis' Narsing Rao et al. 2020]|uniref:MalY/PatB family protein n=1 Tax=Paenibacillus tengchongensis TaxID=2608684 RepID=UPI00124E1FD8|nr:MalY/PatB family protein [Paenibacillus tengchongensis]
MKYDFDRVTSRLGTRSLKWDQLEQLYGSNEVLPLWVADMDFECPPAVKEALIRRAGAGIYGYSTESVSYKQAIIRWFSGRHGWELQEDWLSDSPGVVTSLSLAVELFSEPGGEVIIQPPVYYPFFDVIRMNGRKTALSPLLHTEGRYEMDYGKLEELMKGGARLLLLCNPHNPGGRVWEAEELLRLGELCLRYGVKVISDEIHCDLILPGHKHTPFASLSDELAEITLTALASTKTFNLPGLQTSFIVSGNRDIKRSFDRKLKQLSLLSASFFAHEAVEAAYNEGGEWLDELLLYVSDNVQFATQFLAEKLPQVKVMQPEGTYLLWVDCRPLGLDVEGLKRLMYREAKVAFTEGSIFGEEGRGYLRLNLACPRSVLAEALERFCRAAAPYTVS